MDGLEIKKLTVLSVLNNVFEHKLDDLDDLKGQNQTVLETKNERRMKTNNIFLFQSERSSRTSTGRSIKWTVFFEMICMSEDRKYII